MANGTRVFKIHSVSHFSMILSFNFLFNCRFRKEDGDKNIIKCKADLRLQPLQTVGAEQQSSVPQRKLPKLFILDCVGGGWWLVLASLL